MAAVDLYIEMFCVDLFLKICDEYKIDKNLFKFKNYDNITHPIACIDDIYVAVDYRIISFREMMQNVKTDQCAQFSKSSIDFNLQFELFIHFLGTVNMHLNVFDNLLMLLAFGFYMQKDCMDKLQRESFNAPLCIAMYFDTEFKKEFYEEGGWEALENHVKPYNAWLKTESCRSNINEYSFHSKYALIAILEELYLFNLIWRNFKEIHSNCRGEAVCRRCIPLSHAMVTIFQKLEAKNDLLVAEGCIQFILRLLTLDELVECGRNRCCEKSSNETCQTYVNEKVKKCFQAKILITNKFLSRLFTTHDHFKNNTCMFCGTDILKQEAAVRDYRIEKIKSLVDETQENVIIQSNEATTASVEKWLSITRVDKSKSEMLNLNKSNENHLDDSEVMHTQEAPKKN